MDIRNFFSPGGGAKAKPKVGSKSEDKKDVKSNAADKKENKLPAKDQNESKKEVAKTPVKNKSKTQSQSKGNSKTKGKASNVAKKTKSASRSRNVIEDDDLDTFIIDDSEEEEEMETTPSPKGKEEREEMFKESKRRRGDKDNNANRIKPDDIFTVGDSDEDSPPKRRQDSAKKRKKVNKPLSDDEFEDEAVPQRRQKKKKGKAAKAPKAQVIIDSDSDAEDPLPKKRGRKKKEYVSDSEDENRPTIRAAFNRVKGKPEETPAESKKDKSPPKKMVSINDFFGGGTVHRVERPTPSSATKRKAESSPVKDDFDDLEMHDDDEFAETLALLDAQQPPKKLKLEEDTNIESPPQTPPKSPERPKKSLASKLASKAKGVTYNDTTPEKKSEHFVAETPQGSPPKKKSPAKIPSPKSASPVKSKPDVKHEKKSPAKVSPGKTSPAEAGKVSPGKPSSGKTSPAKSPENVNIADTPTLQRKGTGYRSYLMREPPKALGSKEIPEGAENCMEGLTFVITGVLESMEREEAKSLVERYGGKVVGNVSKKTSYAVVGRDAGVSKLAKIEQFSTKQIDEDGLLDLIRTLPGKKSKYVIEAEKTAAKEKLTSKATASPKVNSSPKVTESPQLSRFRSSQSSPLAGSSQSSQSSQRTASPQKSGQSEDSLLWVDKYKPSSMKQIIGQQGDKSNARKLLLWLKDWHKNRALNKKPAFNRFNDDGSGHKAALLSGPPGVGKTTTAHIVCKEAGFKFVELNASDTRSKKSLENEVAELLNNHTLQGCFGGKPEKMDSRTHCLVMDEVDGMAGNEDRGGMAELIQLIKNSRIPIICMCNDRNHQKIRSLANYCFDLRFQRPRVEQIKAAMMSLAFKEGLKVPPPALNEIILGANQDVRQVIHNLAMWSADTKVLNYDQVKKDANRAKKDTKMGPFDACRKVFVGGEETAHMTINDKAELFFYDYSFHPLFVQENYIHVQPFAARGSKNKHLELLARAADSIAEGDLVDRRIRSKQAWSLLPLQAIHASVIPGEHMRGGIGQMINFPGWLGKNSTTNKTDRILQELRTHMSLHVSGDKKALAMDYLPQMRRELTSPLAKKQAEGIPDVISFMDEYDINRDDFDNIIEVTTWPHMKDPMSSVETKTKAAFTRTYNKEGHLTPYAAVVTAKKKRGGGGGGGGGMEGLEEMEGDAVIESGDEKSDDDMGADAMIKAKKKPAGRGKGKAESKKSSGGAGTSKGKGKGPGKGRGKGKK